MLTLSQILLLLVCLGVALSAKREANRAGPFTAEFSVITLSALAGAIALLGQLTLDPSGSDSGTLLRIGNNLALFAALPMLVTAMGAIAKGYSISRPAWGRWLLALIALFELCRRMGYGEQYALVLALCCLFTLLASLIWFSTRKVRLVLLGATLFMGGSLAAYYLATLSLSLLLASGGLALVGASLKNVQPQLRPE